MYNLTIKVTKDIYERSKMCGKAGGPSHVASNCAIALAVRDIFPYAQVGPDKIVPFGEGYAAPICAIEAGEPTIQLPFKVQAFIVRFDSKTPEQRAASEDFSFDINIPDEVIEKINIDEILPLLENHETLELKLV